MQQHEQPISEAFTEAAALSIGLRSLPHLGDHCFLGLNVLPGAFYVAAALTEHMRKSTAVPLTVRQIVFQNSLILSKEGAPISLERRDRRDPSATEYRFHKCDPAAVKLASDGALLASLRIEAGQAHASSISPKFANLAPVESEEKLCYAQEALYQAFRRNGNEYGPRFQNIEAAWISSSEVVAKIVVRLEPRDTTPFGLHPTLLDAVTQVLGASLIETGKTFLLKSIDKIELFGTRFPEEIWAKATRRSPELAGDDLAGDILVADAAGNLLLALSGVAFGVLDALRSEDPQPETPIRLCIASTLTAEPVEESFRFWADEFGMPLAIEFAPFNQVFQQLLDPESVLARNQNGINLLLLGLEDWLGQSERLVLQQALVLAEKWFGNRSRRVLANGLEIVDLNRHETEYVYKEIFTDRCYLRHGITLPDGATVVDIGANIGLFSLFVLSHSQKPTLYAFEPSPVAFECLEANLAVHGHGTETRAINCGVSDRTKTARFTFYDNASVFSGFHADPTADQHAIEAVVRNVLHQEIIGETGMVDTYVQELTQNRLKSRTWESQLVSLSEFIKVNRIERIHLLKIDAEKSELEILAGLRDCDWPLIDQVVIEVHDRSGATVRAVEVILKARGYQCAVEEEALLENSGLFNVYATRLGMSPITDVPNRGLTALNRQVDEFATALNQFAATSTAPVVVALAPPTLVACHAPLNGALERGERELLARAALLPKVTRLKACDLIPARAAPEYHDPHSHEQGHVPYTPEGYAALGSALFRCVARLNSSPFKVLVLDCDDTLWKGVCGEDGPEGIAVTQPYQFLQKLAIQQMEAGLILCLCSKNQENDVWNVFDRHQEMPLKRSHLTAWRINWKRKSENLLSLAQELHLGLESFIYVDDNPVECAEVRASCPEVLVLQLPGDEESIPSFLKRIWIFDGLVKTETDRQRTRWYQENSVRESLRQSEPSLQKFLDGLELRIEIRESTETQLDRVAQLTVRTNQFNFTQIRRSEQELKSFLQDPTRGCLVASVSDRCGDYGLVGALLYGEQTDRVKIDTFLLSCRALGKGVEHRMLAAVAERALVQGKTWVEIPIVPTERNRPACNFLAHLANGITTVTSNTLCYQFPAQDLAGLKYAPDSISRPPDAGMTPFAPVRRRRRLRWSNLLQRTGDELYEPSRVIAAMQARLQTGVPTRSLELVPSGDGLEAPLARIWRSVLGRNEIGLDENFFEAGGTSLRAVLVVARIRQDLHQTVPILTIFECPTVRLLAAKLTPAVQDSAKPNRAASAERRGQNRRYNSQRRR